MRRNVFLSACLALTLGTAACQDPGTEPTPPASTPGAQLRSTVLDRNLIKLLGTKRLTDRYSNDLIRGAVIPTTCSSSTPVTDWFRAEVARTRAVENAIFEALIFDYLADDVVTFEALVFQTSSTPQYFGYNGEFTQRMFKVEKDVKRFWNIFSDDIQLVGMHGTMLQDEARVAATYNSDLIFGVPASIAAELASDVHALIDASTTMDGGNHPVFSFNAFAFTGAEFGIPDKIIMGDGILEGYKAVGLDDVAPQGVYAHEFGHHIQYENGYIDEPVPGGSSSRAEETRYTELMADAFAGYYLTHSRGASLNRKRVEQFLQAFFQIGDCAFTNPGHHGTPLQRMRAARFGFDVADQARKQGHILTSQAFHALFVAKYPQLIAPDA